MFIIYFKTLSRSHTDLRPNSILYAEKHSYKNISIQADVSSSLWQQQTNKWIFSSQTSQNLILSYPALCSKCHLKQKVINRSIIKMKCNVSYYSIRPWSQKEYLLCSVHCLVAEDCHALCQKAEKCKDKKILLEFEYYISFNYFCITISKFSCLLFKGIMIEYVTSIKVGNLQEPDIK